MKNSFYILVTSSEITDTVQIKHTFKVRIFRGLSRKGITPCSERNSTPRSWPSQDTDFWQRLLSGTMQKTFLPPLVPGCASPPHTSAAAASCAACPQPAQGRKPARPGNPSAGRRSDAAGTHSNATGCRILQTEQRAVSAHRRYPVWSGADTPVQSHSLLQNSLNQKKNRVPLEVKASVFSTTLAKLGSTPIKHAT